MVLTQISIFSLLAIAIERFVAVRLPVFYRTRMRKPKKVHVASAIGLCWVAGTVVGLAPIVGWHRDRPVTFSKCSFEAVVDMNYMVYFNFFGCVLTPLVIIFIIYGYIFHVVRSSRQVNFRGLVRMRSSGGEPNEKKGSNKLDSRREGRRSTIQSKEPNAAKILFIIVVVFALCWLPVHIMNAYTLFVGRTNQYVLMIGIFLSHANSAINPFIYATGNAQFLQALKRTYWRVRRANSYDVTGSSAHGQV